MMVNLSRKPKLHEATTTSPLDALVGKSRITRDDVVRLRESDVSLGLRSRAEAELVFSIERCEAEKCQAWGDFLVEMLTDFAVWDQRPSGILTEDVALWLADQVGETPSPACMALLVEIAEEAQSVPAWFTPAVRLRASKVVGRAARGATQDFA